MSEILPAQREEKLPHPSEWGPHVWYVMDVFVKGYGDHPNRELRQAATQFFHSLKELLPCPHCREHYKSLLKKRPVQTALKNSAVLTKWVEWMKSEVEEVVKRQMIEEHNLSTDPRSLPPSLHPTTIHAQVRNAPAPASMRKRNLGKPRNIPRAHLANPIPKAAPSSSYKKAPASATANKGLNYNQRTAANIAANWKGSQAGLQRYIKSERNYRRPCNCG